MMLKHSSEESNMSQSHMDVETYSPDQYSPNLSTAAQYRTEVSGTARTLRDKNILLISPQPWNHIALSKHHYAHELAARNNRVYFLEPPDRTLSDPITQRSAHREPKIQIVSYRPSLIHSMRFHAYQLYAALIKKHIRRITDHINRSLDVVWCFDPNLFPDLRAFKASCTLFHPVDPLCLQRQFDVAQSADIVLAVSQRILSHFAWHPAAHFVNHGLSAPFESVARERLDKPYIANDPLSAGYAGNVARPPVNRAAIKQIVMQNTDVQFHFWGPCSAQAATKSAQMEIENFIHWLKSQANVHLHGSVKPSRLAEEMRKMDLFFLAYDFHATESDRSNSHKILEYLSMGRTVVSSPIETYQHLSPQLVLMPPSENDVELPQLFRHAVKNIAQLNSQPNQDARIRIALANRYADHLSLIEKYLGQTLWQAVA